MRVWPDLPRFSNQMLRNLRRPEGLVHERGLPAHRAFPDDYVTAHHLRDNLNNVPVDHLLAWSKTPGLLPRVPSGAWRGQAGPKLPWEVLEAVAGSGWGHSLQRPHRTRATGAPCETYAPGLLAQGDLF